MSSRNLRLSMTIKAPADVRPGDFAERLRGHINAAPGYIVQRSSCHAEVFKPRKRSADEQQKEGEKQKYIEQWLEDHPGVKFTRKFVLKAVAEEVFSKLGEPCPYDDSDFRMGGAVIAVDFDSLPPKVRARWCAVYPPGEATALLIRTPKGEYGARISMAVGPFMMNGTIRLGNETEEL